MKIRPIAVAVGSLLPVAAMAATITAPTGNKVSQEYLDAQGGVVAGQAAIALGAQYAVGDVLSLNFNTRPAATNATTGFVFPPTLDIIVGTSAIASIDGTLAKFDEGDNTVSYRVTTAPVAQGSAFGTVTSPANIRFLDAEVVADVTISTSSQTSTGTTFDAGAAKKLVDVTGSQFAYTIGGLSQTIDVESNRTNFAGGTGTGAIITVTSSGTEGSPDKAETGANITVTLGGDFSWIDANTATNATGIETTNIGGDVIGTTASASASQITVTLPATGTSIVLSNSLGLVIPTQTVTASLSQAITSNTVVTGSATASGAYVLNGSSVTVYAVPTSAAASNFIWLSNTGSSDGEVSITVHDAGTSTDLGVVGTSSAGTNFDVTAALNAALAAQGVTLSGGRIHLDIVTKVPAADVAVSAAYRVGDDRVNLLTSIETDHD